MEITAIRNDCRVWDIFFRSHSISDAKNADPLGIGAS